MLAVPERFLDVAYVGARVPGVGDPDDLAAGANCQVFAYALLRHHGLVLPPFRSSELWDDDTYTARVTEFEPLDLMLYHDVPEAFGAHVGVYLGDGAVIHLSKQNGRPVIQPHASFAALPKYAYFIGAKRVRGGSVRGPG
ncbi:MAG TPA: NlpC/P60 family protein [Kofleriaceae bacterium]|nr:NlpC/P60 family protein [Kofleriaceae bacterium]